MEHTSSTQKIQVEPGKVHRLLIILYVVAMLSGSFSLARINNSYAELGEAGYLRSWFLLLLFALVPGLGAIYRNNRSSPKTAWAWATLVLILHLYLALSSTWAPDPNRSMSEVPAVIVVGVSLLMAIPLFQQSPAHSTTFLLTLFVFFSLLYALAGIVGFDRWSHVGRMAAFAGGPNVFVRIMSMGMISAIYMAVKTGKTRWLLFVPLLFMCAILSGSRGGLIALGISLIGYFGTLIWKKFVVWQLLVIPFIVACVMAILYSFSEPVSQFIQHRFIDLTFDEQYGLEGRLALYMEAWNMFLAHPIIGIGLDGYQQTNFYGLSYSHNLILQIAAEGGMVSLLILGITLAIPMLLIKQATSLEAITILCLSLYHFVAGMFSGTYLDARWMWFFLCIYLITISVHRANRSIIATPNSTQ